MFKTITIAIRLTIVCMFFFCGIYLLSVWAVAQLAPGKGKGITIEQNGKKYYPLIGQAFTGNQYFWSRPSAVDYNAAGSGGSNKGPGNAAYLAQVQSRIDTLLAHHAGLKTSEIPSDLVTAGGSGLDPHISVQAADIQVRRVAAARKLAESDVRALVLQYTEDPLLGLFGPTKINVLQLNLALDRLSQSK